MFELNGKYNTAKVFTDNVDNTTVGQLMALLNQKFTEGSRIRIMPDTHAGKGCVIGTTMTLNRKVCPNLVGVDIGCGMMAVRLRERTMDFGRLDSVIAHYIPSGFDIRENAVAYSDAGQIKAPVDVDRAMKSLGTLGGGNHFIEVDRDSEGQLWLVIHSGSRHLGIEVCEYYQKLAYDRLRSHAAQKEMAGVLQLMGIDTALADGDIAEMRRALVSRLTEQGRQKEISKALKTLNAKYQTISAGVPYELAYVEGGDFEDYLHDMKLAQSHAKINRQTIARVIMDEMHLHKEESFDTVHNYIDTDNMVLRKGAISAAAGERVLIPMNMRDGSLICVGRGNPDWNCSAPHGAGRVLSRSEAKESIPMKEFKAAMEGIYTTSVGTSTVDEAPQAYKPMDEIIENIGDTVDIVDIIKPVYNFKAH